jgi:hypothetical protein
MNPDRYTSALMTHHNIGVKPYPVASIKQYKHKHSIGTPKIPVELGLFEKDVISPYSFTKIKQHALYEVTEQVD